MPKETRYSRLEEYKLLLSRPPKILESVKVRRGEVVVSRISQKLRGIMNQKVMHPMDKLQREVNSLVKSNIIKPTDSIWKIALLFGDKWQFWKKELQAVSYTHLTLPTTSRV